MEQNVYDNKSGVLPFLLLSFAAVIITYAYCTNMQGEREGKEHVGVTAAPLIPDTAILSPFLPFPRNIPT